MYEDDDEEVLQRNDENEMDARIFDSLQTLIDVMRDPTEERDDMKGDSLKREVFDGLMQRMRGLVGQVNDLTGQLDEAREALDSKDDMIERLKAESEHMLDGWKSSTEEAANCIQSVEETWREMGVLKQVVLRLEKERAELVSKLRVSKTIPKEKMVDILRRLDDTEQAQLELQQNMTDLQERNGELEQQLQKRDDELEQAFRQTNILMDHLGDLKDTVQDLKRREAHYRRIYMQTEAENAELRVTVHALKYPVAQASDKRAQTVATVEPSQSQPAATPPSSRVTGNTRHSPNSGEDDRFFTPHSTRRPQRQASPSRAAEETSTAQLPKPLSISTLTTDHSRDSEAAVVADGDNKRALKPVNGRHATPPAGSTDKPTFWNRLRDFWQDPDAPPEVLKTPRATQRPLQQPHSVTFSSDGEITVFSPVRQQRYHATPQALGEQDLNESPTTEGDASSRDDASL